MTTDETTTERLYRVHGQTDAFVTHLSGQLAHQDDQALRDYRDHLDTGIARLERQMRELTIQVNSAKCMAYLVDAELARRLVTQDDGQPPIMRDDERGAADPQTLRQASWDEYLDTRIAELNAEIDADATTSEV